jgi:hypothetical protein
MQKEGRAAARPRAAFRQIDGLLDLRAVYREMSRS